MPESGAAEGESLTLNEWLRVVKDAGWTLRFVQRETAHGVAIEPRLFPPTNKRQSHLPAAVNNQFGRFKVELMATTFGERADDGFRHCPTCQECYAAKLWQDVAAMCDKNLCPLRSVT